jgi:hypothetical protein
MPSQSSVVLRGKLRNFNDPRIGCAASFYMLRVFIVLSALNMNRNIYEIFSIKQSSKLAQALRLSTYAPDREQLSVGTPVSSNSVVAAAP